MLPHTQRMPAHSIPKQITSTHLWPLVTLGLVLVEAAACLQHWLLGTTTTSNLADHSTALAADDLQQST